MRVRIALLGLALTMATSCTPISSREDGASSELNDPDAGPPPAPATCAPERGVRVVNRFEKSLHDSIAWAEGTKGFSKDGYDVTFGFHLFPKCTDHPRTIACQGHLCSDAAGRYQFLDTTWDSVADSITAPDFEPETQERATEYLINKIRRVTVPPTRSFTASEFTNAMNKLSYEWASLPPGRYGQPTKTRGQMWSDYQTNIRTSADAGAPTPPPAHVAHAGSLASSRPGDVIDAIDTATEAHDVAILEPLLALVPTSTTLPSIAWGLGAIGKYADSATQDRIVSHLSSLVGGREDLVALEALGALDRTTAKAILVRELTTTDRARRILILGLLYGPRVVASSGSLDEALDHELAAY